MHIRLSISVIMDILFWSGGKDAFLALQFYQKQYPGQELQLLTTYEETTNIVPHQNIPLSHIQKQAATLELKLNCVPLPRECPNEVYLDSVDQALKQIKSKIEWLVFGDLHLQDVRSWREEMFEKRGYKCRFPIWNKSIHELLPVLQLQPVSIKISAVMDKFRHLIRVGESFDQSFIKQLQYLQEDIDPMGEKGEFHTKVSFHTPKAPPRQEVQPQVG